MKRFICFCLSVLIFFSCMPIVSYGVGSSVVESALESFTQELVQLVKFYDSQGMNEELLYAASQDGETDFSYQDSTNRIIVKATDAIDECGAVAHIEGYNSLHILQYTDKATMKAALEFYKTCSNVIYAQEDCINKADSVVVEDASDATIIENPMQAYSDAHGFTALKEKLNQSEKPFTDEVTVAVIDTGADSDHELLVDKLEPTGFDSINGISCEDDQGHGTHVAGIIAANTVDNVKIRPYKVLNSEGRGSDSQIILGIEAAIADGVDVINLSLGRRGESEAMEEVIQRAHNAGIVVVAAAGNDGTNLDSIPYSPASCENVITVMACGPEPNGGRASFSNYGKVCETVAIGYSVNSSYLDNTYVSLSGTSMAAPFVAACVTYLKFDDPTVAYSEVVDIIDKFEVDNSLYAEYILDDEILQLSAPVFSVVGCDFAEEFYLELSCDNNAIIYYKISTRPSNMWSTYTEPIKIKYDTTITAYVAKRGAKSSETVEQTYNRIFPSEDDMYEITAEGVITEYLGPNEEGEVELIIPDTIKGIKPTTIGDKVFYEFNYLENIVLPNSVTSIGGSSFARCQNLKFVTGRGVSSIGSSAFSCCYSLLDFIGSNITEISSYSFSYCSSLRFVDIRNLTIIPGAAFKDASLTQAIISDKIVEIGDQAFYGTKIPSVDTPNLTTLGQEVFLECYDLVRVSIPQITTIKQSCFGACTALEEIYAPLITEIDWHGLSGCTSLESVDFPLLERVGRYSFKGCTSIKSFDFPLVTYIDQYAFRECTALETINVPLATSLGNYAFWGCTSLKSFDCSKIITLGSNTFWGCSSIEELEFKDKVNVPSWAFTQGIPVKKIIFDSPDAILDLPDGVPVAIPSSLTTFKDRDTEDVIIYGTKGSYAEEWAYDYDQTFIEITPQSAILSDIGQFLKTYNQTLYFDVIGFNRTYQWYGNSVKSNTGGTAIEGATDCRFTPATVEDKYNYYYCVATSKDGTNDTVYITSCVSTYIPVGMKAIDEGSDIDFDLLTIFTYNLCQSNLDNIVEFDSNGYYVAIPSQATNNSQFLGTGSSIIVYADGIPKVTFDMVVYGDVNGDSTCDALDCARIILHNYDVRELEGVYLSAADYDSSGKVDDIDYQAAVNRALA